MFPARSLGNERLWAAVVYFLLLCEQGFILLHSLFRQSVPFPPLPHLPQDSCRFLKFWPWKNMFFRSLLCWCVIMLLLLEVCQCWWHSNLWHFGVTVLAEHLGSIGWFRWSLNAYYPDFLDLLPAVPCVCFWFWLLTLRVFSVFSKARSRDGAGDMRRKYG